MIACIVIIIYPSCQKEEACEGVNILLFDNDEMICTLQHHFVRHSSSNKNILRFTKVNGEELHIDAT